jgi:RNA polymerase sigma-70 factor (ECF subfamily)
MTTLQFVSCRENAVQISKTEYLNDALRGDPDSFRQLVESYQTAVFNLCYRMLGDTYEAEDAAQETFFRAYKSRHHYDKQRSFSTWLLSIAAHHCIDQLRRRKMNMVSIENLPYQDLRDPNPNPETTLSNTEKQRQVRKLLSSLNPADRAAVVMYYWYDFSYDEIADSLRLTLSAVKSRLHRARKEMAQIWMTQHSQNNPEERINHGSPGI